MKKGIFDRRIPTLFAFLILLGGLVISSILVKQGLFIVSRATPNEEPQNVQVTNITDTSFTVVFTTLDPTLAGVTLADSTTPTVYYDARNPEGGKTFVSHSITVGSLKPGSTYSFSILSNGATYQDNGKDFEAKTGNVHIPVSSSSFALQGKVLSPDGLPGSDVLVVAQIPNAQTVSAVTNDEGVYSIPTSLITNISDGQTVTLFPKTQIKITATKALLTSQATYDYQPGEDIPTISLSNNYVFTASTDENVPVGTPSSNLTVPEGAKQTETKITVPKQDQSFTDSKPQFQGTAGPNSLVRISIEPDATSVEVRSNPNGNWSYRPGIDLLPGHHVITVAAPNAAGVNKSVQSNFTIFASGSQVAESATPSATLTPTKTPTPIPTATPTPTGSILPTTTVTPSAIPTPTSVVIATPTPTVIALISTPTPIAVVPPKSIPPEAVPPTGSTSQTIFLTTISLLFIVSGSALLFIL